MCSNPASGEWISDGRRSGDVRFADGSRTRSCGEEPCTVGSTTDRALPVFHLSVRAIWTPSRTMVADGGGCNSTASVITVHSCHSCRHRTVLCYCYILTFAHFICTFRICTASRTLVALSVPLRFGIYSIGFSYSDQLVESTSANLCGVLIIFLYS